jgi:hypothetical protein
MKKIILSTIFLSISASLMTAQAAVENSFADQLMMQKKQLHPQEFNFFSDRYKQVKAQQNVNQNQSAVVKDENSIAAQLMMQKKQLHPQEFNFFSDRYKQVKAQQQVTQSPYIAAEGEKLSFKMQLDGQKQLLRHHKFYPVSDAYYQIISR